MAVVVDDGRVAALLGLQSHRRAAARRRPTEVDAIFFVLSTGSRWNDLPCENGASTTAFRRFQQWNALGVWERIYRAALGELEDASGIDWQKGAIDGSFAPAKRGATGSA